MNKPRKYHKDVQDELEEEIGEEIESGEEESEIMRATDNAKQGESGEIRDRKGRKLKVKIEKIDPSAAVDDYGGYC